MTETGRQLNILLNYPLVAYSVFFPILFLNTYYENLESWFHLCSKWDAVNVFPVNSSQKVFVPFLFWLFSSASPEFIRILLSNLFVYLAFRSGLKSVVAWRTSLVLASVELSNDLAYSEQGLYSLESHALIDFIGLLMFQKGIFFFVVYYIFKTCSIPILIW